MITAKNLPIWTVLDVIFRRVSVGRSSFMGVSKRLSAQ